MKGLVVPAELHLIEVGGQRILYNPELHTWDAVSEQELSAVRLLQHGSLDLDSAVRESLLRLVLSALLYVDGSQPAKEKVTVFPASPQAVYWTITQRCNLRCVYCYADASPEPKDELNTAQSLAALESIASVGPRWIFFTGGEPLVRTDVFELAHSCRDHGIHVGLLTNATLIDESTADAIVAAFDSVAVSLDSAEPSFHDAARGQGTHARAMRGIELLMKRGLTPSVNTTVTSVNARDVINLARLMRDMGITEHRLSIHMPVGRGRSDCVGCETSALVRVLNQLLQDGTWKDLKRKSPATFQAYLPRRFSPKRQCGLGTSELSVDQLGRVYPCRLLNNVPKLVAGNVLESPLSLIYRQSQVLLDCRAIAVEDIPGCSKCAYRYFCGGGCRALAYHDKGDLRAEFTGLCLVNQLEFGFLLAEERQAAHAEALGG